MAHKVKDFAADIKAAGDDGGSIVAYASTFDRTPDSYGDVVAKGAFADTLAAWKASGKPIPLLFNHDTDDPFHNIGAVTDAEEDDIGLKVTATLDPDNPTAQYVRSLVKQGRVSKMSFAYDVQQAGEVTLDTGEKANELQKLNLFEVSIVPIPANQNADILEVKNGEQKAIATAFIDLIPRLKSGRVLSKSVEDKLSQASTLINDVLKLVKDADETDDGGKHREPDGSKGANVDRELIKKMEDLTK